MNNSIDPYVVCQKSDGICELHLSRPDKKNALNFSMYKALAEHIASADQCAAVHVLIITGNKDNFTAGNDLSDFTRLDEVIKPESPVLQFMEALKNCSKPVIVAINGVAIGIGTTLLLHCDLAYASESASFQLPFTALGLCPEYASSLLLPCLVGHVKASEWLLLGSIFSAKEALDAGLINAIGENPLALARKSARTLAKRPPMAVAQTKRLLKQPMAEQVNTVLKKELSVFIQALQGDEFAEAVTAFFEKRDPNFS